MENKGKIIYFILFLNFILIGCLTEKSELKMEKPEDPSDIGILIKIDSNTTYFRAVNYNEIKKKTMNFILCRMGIFISKRLLIKIKTL